MPTTTHSEAVTKGIRVFVQPAFLPDRSRMEEGLYVFAYHIRIVNESDMRVQLLSRHWIIINSDGDREDVEGPGVVGLQPELLPGASFDYTSYCPLNTSFGTMEGTFRFRNEEGDEFDVKIARFYLATNAPVLMPFDLV